jgi:TPR repeat protein
VHVAVVVSASSQWARRCGHAGLLITLGTSGCVATAAPQDETRVPMSPEGMTVTTHRSRPPEATAGSTDACTAGNPEACHAAALDAYFTRPDQESDGRALMLFQRGCDAGYAPSCNGLGVLYEEGRGVTKDQARALSLYRRSCEANATTGCLHLASCLRAGRGVAKDAAAADRAEARGRCLFDASLANDGRACPSL